MAARTAANRLPEMSPWRRHPLTIPPDSWSAWVRLATWECWMGVLIYAAISVATHLVVSAPNLIVTVFDFKNCYVAHVVQPCERVAYRAGALSVAFNLWCSLLLLAVGAWLLWELWNAVAPKPITDDFLKLLDESFRARLAQSADLAVGADSGGPTASRSPAPSPPSASCCWSPR